MKISNFKKARFSSQLSTLTIGFVMSASAVAAVTSASTGTVKGRAPVMAPPTFTYVDTNANGVIDNGDVYTAVDGAITDADSDASIASTYRWHIGGADVGTAGAYTIQPTDHGETLTLSAIPRTDPAVTDPAFGAEVDANATIDIASNDTLVSVTISGLVAGNPQVGSPLTADVVCVTACGAGLRYTWKLETGFGTGIYSDIPGATNATYVPVGGDQRRMIQVAVDN